MPSSRSDPPRRVGQRALRTRAQRSCQRRRLHDDALAGGDRARPSLGPGSCGVTLVDDNGIGATTISSSGCRAGVGLLLHDIGTGGAAGDPVQAGAATDENGSRGIRRWRVKIPQKADGISPLSRGGAVASRALGRQRLSEGRHRHHQFARIASRRMCSTLTPIGHIAAPPAHDGAFIIDHCGRDFDRKSWMLRSSVAPHLPGTGVVLGRLLRHRQEVRRDGDVSGVWLISNGAGSACRGENRRKDAGSRSSQPRSTRACGQLADYGTFAVDAIVAPLAPLRVPEVGLRSNPDAAASRSSMRQRQPYTRIHGQVIRTPRIARTDRDADSLRPTSGLRMAARQVGARQAAIASVSPAIRRRFEAASCHPDSDLAPARSSTMIRRRCACPRSTCRRFAPALRRPPPRRRR